MANPDRSDEAKKLTSYYNASEKAFAYGVMQTGISYAVMYAGGAALTIDASKSGDFTYLMYGLLTAATVSLGLMSTVDGLLTIHRSTQEIRAADEKILSRQFRLRGFFLNRTVVA